MLLASLKIIKTNANSFRHVPSVGSPYYISKGHYSMQNDVMTIVEEGKAQRLQVLWQNVSLTPLNDTETFYTTFDNLDNALVDAGYNLAKQKTASTNQNQIIPFEQLFHFKGVNNFNVLMWENGDVGAGFLATAVFMPFGYWSGGTVPLNSGLLQDTTLWQTSYFDPYI